MMKQLRANSERVQRSAARPAFVANGRPAFVARPLAGRPAATRALVMNELMTDRGFGNAAYAPFGTDATTTAWNVKPSVHPTAICTFGKYHTRRLQEMPT